MEKMKKITYQTGKILYNIATFPLKILIGYYDPKKQKILKENRELKSKIKSLDTKIMEQNKELVESSPVKKNRYISPRLN